MQGIRERCSVCSGEFDVQFSYQMEERDGGFAFFCSQGCQGKALRGETSGGVTCAACNKVFYAELVSQVVRTGKGRSYACSDECREQVLLEEGGVRLGSIHAATLPPVTIEVAREVTPMPSTVASPVATPTTSTTAVAPAATTTTSFATPTPSAVKTPAPARVSRSLASPKHLAIFNHKGGTGKTTTSVSLAAGLAERGYKVLLVDTDSQGNVGVSLNLKTKLSLYHVLVMGMAPAQVAVNVRPNFDVIVANETLAAAELYLAGRTNRDRVLRERLIKVAGDYDVVLVDCSPSLSLLNQNALVFADGVLVPVACDFLSIVGVRQVVRTVKNVNSLLRHPVQIHGVLPTFYDARARIAREAHETLQAHFGDRCFAPIRAATRLKEAPSVGKTIFEYAPDSNAAADYRSVVERIISGAVAPVSESTEGPSSASETNLKVSEKFSLVS